MATSLPDEMNPQFKSIFNDEIIKSVFNDTKRIDLSLAEEDIVSFHRSERGFSIDETAELALEDKDQDVVMQLKKTTILTGNHAASKRARASSDYEVMQLQFKGATTADTKVENSSPANPNTSNEKKNIISMKQHLGADDHHKNHH